MENFIIFVYSYLMGSIPTAYLVLKRKGLNILHEGSGNVGTLNSYDVTKSKLVGIFVLTVDFFKGFLAVLITQLVFGDNFFYLGIAISSAVLGHCFSIWVKFKGGRGLASALGGSVLFVPQLPIIWITIWLIGFAYKKNVHFSNISATVLTLLLTIFSGNILYKYSLVKTTELEYISFVSIVLLLILIKHIKPLQDYLKNQKKNLRGINE